MSYFVKDFQLLQATTSTGAGTPTSVVGFDFIHIQMDGLSFATTPATSTRVVCETTVNNRRWVMSTVVDLNNNTATTTLATDSIYRLGDCGGISGIRLRVATFNGVGASISAVARAFGRN